MLFGLTSRRFASRVFFDLSVNGKAGEFFSPFEIYKNLKNFFCSRSSDLQAARWCHAQDCWKLSPAVHWWAWFWIWGTGDWSFFAYNCLNTENFMESPWKATFCYILFLRIFNTGCWADSYGFSWKPLIYLFW